MPFFSLIIPTYNSSKTISTAITSVLNQNFTDFEILILDALSVDNTINIAKQKNDNRIKIFSEKDTGIYNAMNKGLKLAEGDWLYFLGSDDELACANVLKAIADFIAQHKYEVVYGDVLIQGTAPWASDGDRYDGYFDFEKLLNKNICHQAIFYNKNMLNKNNIQFNEAYLVCADWDFNFKCWAVSKFGYLPVIIAKFSAGGLSTKALPKDNFDEDFVKNIIHYFQIHSFKKLQTILPSTRLYQLGKINKYAFRMKLHNLIQKLGSKKWQ